MGKLILHMVVAALLVAVSKSLSLGWLITCANVVVGAVCVHLVWERFLVSPFVHLGAMPIADDDPILVRALERAKESWPHFLTLYSEHKDDSIVKFSLRTSDGDIENLWGDLLDIGPDSAQVYVRTPPIGDLEIPDRRMTVPLGDIVDWQVEYRDGTLRGGFSMQASYRIFEREEGYMPPELMEQLQRYRDIDEPAE